MDVNNCGPFGDHQSPENDVIRMRKKRAKNTKMKQTEFLHFSYFVFSRLFLRPEKTQEEQEKEKEKEQQSGLGFAMEFVICCHEWPQALPRHSMHSQPHWKK